MKKREFLPLGSVVTLEGAEKRLMITGRLQQEPSTGTVFDYSAVLWPEGMISSDKVYLFSQESIERIWFIGLQDAEEFEFRSYLDDQYEQLDLQ